MINHRQLEAFHAVVLMGATTRAAEILGVSQPAISRLIKHLERSTKLKLFERSNGRLILTREGLLFHSEVNRAFQTLGRLGTVADDIRNYRAQPLKVGALPAMSFSFVPHVVGAFHSAYPHAMINLEPASSDIVRDLVAAGHLDIGFVADEVDISGVFAEQFAMPPVVCVLPKGHDLTRKAVIEPGDLADQPFISLSHADRTRRRIDQIFDRQNIARNVVAETHFALTICQFVQQGLGVGLINPYCLESIATDSVVVRPFLPRITFRTMMIYAPTSPITGVVETFRSISHKMATSFLYDLMRRFDAFANEESERAFGQLAEPGPWIRNPLA
ncbi:LysR family transcriptional regulator [Rhizobium leguminosarum]|uniref:LysR substrate-binding domain-containing protein n=1 Tax=Rhizobium leguminosarum TaxID=384 RepID=UPI001441C8AA|nr:LysR substrate-binding domain-containing protein [Rhizobium leguminosarum]MBY5836291.1 LysR family transcriptional regulator [Rhizobium leguminosarum]QSZ08609.1 LysR family transcriptional regulator [Rhizobium leguminosarum]